MEDGVLYTANVTFDTSVIVTYDTPVTAPYAYEDDGAGGSVLVYAPPEYDQTEIINTKPDSGGPPQPSPVLNIDTSFGEWESYQPIPESGIFSILQKIHISWFPVDYADYYQVFLILNSLEVDLYASNAFLFGTDEDLMPTKQYTGGALFDYDSGPLYTLDFEYMFDTYITGGTEHYRRASAFVFAYNDYGRSRFPLTMMSFVADGKERFPPYVNTLFIENTSYRNEVNDPGKSTNLIDLSSNIGGAAQNLQSKAMTKYVPPPPYIPGE
jgi:hypothetical protein